MIQLTRLNNSKLTINSDLIKFVEQSPDTVITLLHGEKILVQEPVHEIIKRVLEFRRQLIAGLTIWEAARAAPFAAACSPSAGKPKSAEQEGEG